jgi:hypothetical protein
VRRDEQRVGADGARLRRLGDRQPAGVHAELVRLVAHVEQQQHLLPRPLAANPQRHRRRAELLRRGAGTDQPRVAAA